MHYTIIIINDKLIKFQGLMVTPKSSRGLFAVIILSTALGTLGTNIFCSKQNVIVMKPEPLIYSRRIKYW